MDTWIAAVIAVILAALPFVLAGVVVVVGVAILVLIFAFVLLFQQPPRIWLLILCIILDVVLLVPVWLASWLISSSDPAIWQQAREPIYIFSLVLVSPTVLQSLYCLWKAETKDELIT